MVDVAPGLQVGKPVPVAFADRFRFLVVMPRADQPVTFDDVVAATPGSPSYASRASSRSALTHFIGRPHVRLVEDQDARRRTSRPRGGEVEGMSIARCRTDGIRPGLAIFNDPGPS